MRFKLTITILLLLLGFPIVFAPISDAGTTYLPMAFSPPPTPTAPPVTPLVNGNFEQGNVGWVAVESAVVLNSPALARSSAWLGWLGSDRKKLSSLSQEVTITADAPYLVYWSSVSSEEFKCTYDYAYVRSILIGTIDRIDEFCKDKQHAAYRKRVVDLRKWVGVTIDLGFYMSTDVALGSYWHIDDVQLQASP